MKFRLLIIALAICVISTPAMADLYGTVNVAYQDLVRGYSTLDLTVDAGLHIYSEHDIGLHTLNLGALDTTTPPADTALPSDSNLKVGLVQAFCIDLIQGFPIPTEETPLYQYDAVSLNEAPDPGGPMGNDKALYIAQLLNANTYTDADSAAALQIAIWEVLYETSTSWDVDSGEGSFYLDTTQSDEATIAGLANAMLLGLSQATSFSQYTALSEYGKNMQDFVLVPVPAAVLLGILGLGIAGIKLRKYA